MLTMAARPTPPTYYLLSPSCQLDERLAIIDMMGPGPYRFERRETINGVVNLWLRPKGGAEYAIPMAVVELCPNYRLAVRMSSFDVVLEHARRAMVGNPKRVEGWGLWVGRAHYNHEADKLSLDYEWTYRWAPLDFGQHARSIPVDFVPVYLVRESITTIAA
jgi:hypothetical protein